LSYCHKRSMIKTEKSTSTQKGNNPMPVNPISVMDRKIFDLKLSVETVSMYLLCCGLVDSGATLSTRNLADRWNGNAETMRTERGAHTAHTTNPVRLILMDDKRKTSRLREGILGDIAPTILGLMEIPKPPQMTGRSLLEQ